MLLGFAQAPRGGRAPAGPTRLRPPSLRPSLSPIQRQMSLNHSRWQEADPTESASPGGGQWSAVLGHKVKSAVRRAAAGSAGRAVRKATSMLGTR